jgi:hypothetical protein
MINLQKGLSKTLMRELALTIANTSKKLMRLRLSKINLNDSILLSESNIIESLCELFRNSDMLSYLDLSWTSLSPRHLLDILDAII